MAEALKAANDSRTRRVSVLVNEDEYRRIEADAERAGLSVSAYLRSCALGEDETLEAALTETLDRIERDLDEAVAKVDDALDRMGSRG